jgi:maleylacetoacetate isomerase
MAETLLAFRSEKSSAGTSAHRRPTSAQVRVGCARGRGVVCCTPVAHDNDACKFAHRNASARSKAGEGIVKLYTFWRSLATYRVRVVLNLKNIGGIETVSIDLLKGDQLQSEYLKINPQKVVPALVLDDGKPPLFQSMAIMEYLDETHPEPPLLPKDARGRARVRGLAQIVIADAHPLSVPRIRKYLTEVEHWEHERLNAWIGHWQAEALGSLEGHLVRDPDTGRYCHGDTLTLADICLASQAVAAGFFKLDLTPYPTVKRIAEACFAQDAFAREHPSKQPGAQAR